MRVQGRRGGWGIARDGPGGEGVGVEERAGVEEGDVVILGDGCSEGVALFILPAVSRTVFGISILVSVGWEIMVFKCRLVGLQV